MFGYPTLVLGGNMFMGLHEDRLILRLSEDDRARFLESHGGDVFEPMPGRPMREYVVVPTTLSADDVAMRTWVHRSADYARHLPVKSPKRAKTPRRSRRPV